MKCLYKYPHGPFPYACLVDENRRRGRNRSEFELLDTGVFDDDRYFDVFVEYAKGGVEDILIRITAINRGPDPARLHLLPSVWFRNTWSWRNGATRPSLGQSPEGSTTLVLDEPYYGRRWLYCDADPELLFTENETNVARLYGVPNRSRHVKDAFHEFVIHGRSDAVNPDRVGTKAAARYVPEIGPGETFTCRLRFTEQAFPPAAGAFGDFDRVFAARRAEADQFYAAVTPSSLSADGQHVMRQAFAGLLWSKQFYH